MFLNQVPAELILEWLSMEACARVACLDTQHRKTISSSRWAPVLYDPELQKVWKKYIDAKNERKELRKELPKRATELFKECSFSNVAGWICSRLISERLQHIFPFVKQGLEAAERMQQKSKEGELLSARFDTLQKEKENLKTQFLSAKEDARVMGLFGGREKYNQLPLFLGNIGVVEEPFKVFQKTGLPLLKDAFSRETYPTVSFFRSNDKALFLSAVLHRVTLQPGQEQGNEILLEEISSVLEGFPELLSNLQKKFAAISADGDPWKVNRIQRALFEEDLSAPVTRISVELPNGRFFEAFAIKIKNVELKQDLSLLCYRRDKGSWFTRCGEDIFELIENSMETRLFDTSREESIFDSYDLISDLLTKGKVVQDDGDVVIRTS